MNGVYFLKSAVGSCFAQGAPSGVVVDSGETYTTVARILDGYQEVVNTLGFGGNVVTNEL